MATVHTIDLNFLGLQQAIASYLIPHDDGAVLVESGPASTLPALKEGIARLGYALNDITDLLVTHIHLDHAGAAGWLAREGIRVHVHPLGAPHLVEPRRLIDSATRIYGDQMERLWGQIVPVPEGLVRVVEDQAVLRVGGLAIETFDTPGHANHHHAYLLDGTCFCGDVGGIRLPSSEHVEMPYPPPEIDLDSWRRSLDRLQALDIHTLAPTHFGLHPDAGGHFQSARAQLDQVEAWIEAQMAGNPDLPALRERFAAWSREQRLSQGLDEDELARIEAANPAWMSAAGLLRFWSKFRAGTGG